MDLPLAPRMTCSALAYGVQDGAPEGNTSGASLRVPNARQRRRHSSFSPRRKSIVNHIMDTEEGLLLRVDLFLSELERRLEYVENYCGEVRLDASISRAFATLQAVRARCSQVSEEVIGAGRRRLQAMVETLEARYHEALVAAESMNEKARVGIELLDDMLEDYETRALKLRDQGLANAADAAGSLMDEGRRVVDESLERARHVTKGVVDESLGRAKRAAYSLEEHIQRAVGTAREKGLLHLHELPEPWQINAHVLSGYRFKETKLGCVQSMFGVSNEMVNIWSHALGLIVVLSLAFFVYPNSTNFSLSNTTDVLIAGLFFYAACQCLVCSTVWHTMNCVADKPLMERFACVDYTGISLLIAASIMTTEYTVFYCEPISRWTYMSITALLGVGGTVLPWNPYFNSNNASWLRVGFFCGLASTALFPFFQVMLTRGPESALEFYTATDLVKSLTVYFVGACIYASKVPERWIPGAFDYFGNAHNLWHFAVLGGILYHYVAMQEFFARAFERAQTECPAF